MVRLRAYWHKAIFSTSSLLPLVSVSLSSRSSLFHTHHTPFHSHSSRHSCLSEPFWALSIILRVAITRTLLWRMLPMQPPSCHPRRRIFWRKSSTLTALHCEMSLLTVYAVFHICISRCFFFLLFRLGVPFRADKNNISLLCLGPPKIFIFVIIDAKYVHQSEQPRNQRSLSTMKIKIWFWSSRPLTTSHWSIRTRVRWLIVYKKLNLEISRSMRSAKSLAITLPNNPTLPRLPEIRIVQ